MESLKEFSQKKEDYLKKLTTCKTYIERIEQQLNTDLSFYKQKINKAIEELKEDKVKVVFFGGFSDGKSTILAALTGNLSIEIAPEPTTDRIRTYNYKDFILVDTPGLFSENIPHDEETKKFISEADLIIFTTNAINPLKESQHKVIKWLLKDLGKISQTIFVINKLDTIAVLYSKEDFQRSCEIKKNTVKNTLNNILEEEREDYLIICMSADPWGMGLKYWFQNKEEYRKLSNIEELEKAISQIIEEKGSQLKEKTIKAILKDIAIRSYKEFNEKLKELEIAIAEADANYQELQEQLNILRKELRKATTRIRTRLDSFREDIISEIQACNDLSCLKEFIDKKLGHEGNALKTKIEIIIDEEIEPLYEYSNSTTKVLERIADKLDELEITHFKLIEIGSPILKATGKALNNTPANLIRDGILKTRDFLKLPIKFKPWQVVKIAKLLKIIGSILDIIEKLLKAWNYYAFQKAKDDLIQALNELFKEIDSFINPKFIKEKYLPYMQELEKAEKEIHLTLTNYKNLIKAYKEAQNTFQKCSEALK